MDIHGTPSVNTYKFTSYIPCDHAGIVDVSGIVQGITQFARKNAEQDTTRNYAEGFDYMTDKSNKQIARMPYKHLTDIVKSISYATSQNKVELGAIHFHPTESSLRISCTDGFRYSSVMYSGSHANLDSFGIDAKILLHAIDEIKSCAKLKDIYLLIEEESIVIEVQDFKECRVSIPISTRWKNYYFLNEPVPHFALAHIDTRDVINACRKTSGENLVLSFRRGIGASATSITVAARDKDGEQWNEAIWLPAFETSNNCADCEIIHVGIQKKFLIDALRRCGKTARIEMISKWPVRTGGIRIIGTNDSTHLIAAMKL